MKKKGIALVLCLCMLLGCIPAFAVVVAKVPDANVVIDGKEVDLRGYNIGGANYFKLRDLAMALSETEKAFDVTWDAGTSTITLIPGKPYTPLGGELSGGATGESMATASTHRVLLDGKEQDLDAYNIGGANYFKLRDVLGVLGVAVDWDETNRTIVITTREPEQETELVENEVVSIICSDDDNVLSGQGLGIVVSEDGKILTSYNIMKRAHTAYATYRKDGKRYEITGFIAYDEKKNLALVKSTIVSDSPVSLAQEELGEASTGSVFTLGSSNEFLWQDIQCQEWREDSFTEGWQINLNATWAEAGAPVFNDALELTGIVYPRYYPSATRAIVAPVTSVRSWLAKDTVTDFETFRKENYPLSETKTLKDVVSLIGARYATIDIGGETVRVSKITLTEDPDHYKRLYYQIFIEDTQAGTRMYEDWYDRDTEELQRSLENYVKKIITTSTNYYMDYEVSGDVFIQVSSRDNPGESDTIFNITENANGGYNFWCRFFRFEFTDLVGFLGEFALYD